MINLARAFKWATSTRLAPELLGRQCQTLDRARLREATAGERFAGLARSAVRSDCAVPLVVAFVLCLTFLTVPRMPLTNGMESSWSAVLCYAHQEGLQFGTNIIYTYGPLGFLSVFYFTPYTTGWRLIADGMLCFGVASGLCLLAWRLRTGWRLLTLAMFTLLAANIKTGTADLLINIGLLCLGLLCACECRRRLRLYTLGLMLLAIFSALTKVTGLVVAGVTVCVVTADLWLRGRHRLSLALMLGFVAGFLGGWVVLGQRVSQIAAFLSGGLEIAGGYNGTMAVEPPATALAGGVLTLFAALGAVLTRYHAQVAGNTKQKWQQRLLFAWLLLLLFVTWKHGFVRADEHHAIFFLGFASVLSLVLGALPCPTSKPCRWTYQLAGACCLCAVVTLQLLLYPDFLRLDRPFRQAAANAATLLRPGAYCEQMKRSLRLERHRASLPRLREVIGQAPVDVFGNYQAYAVFNDLNYRPRPVFQSYSAYTASLMTVNERFYASGAAPEFVMARLDTIDNRLPVLEDALTFRYLLTNYKPTANERGFVLLQSRSAIAPELTLLREGTVRPDELIDLKPYRHSVLWLEIDLEPTVAGRLRQCIYQPSPVWLRAWHTSLTGSSKQFLAPAQMMKAGFVASPLILSNQCLLDLYAGKPVTRPTAYSVEIAPSNRFLWHGVILYRVYTLDNLATAAPDRHSSNRSVSEGHE